MQKIKATRKVRREAIRAKGAQKDPRSAREAREARKEQEKTFKVVLLDGGFSVAPFDFDAPEARASLSERIKRYGLGSECGLPKGFALSLARKLQAARNRRRKRRA
jgi:hypothetical protein